jgi:hypothetical protein
MAVPDEETKAKADKFLVRLVSLARLPKDTEITILISPFMDAVAQAPRADLDIFGLSRAPDMQFVQNLTKLVNGSCVFVRDSGDESALA